MRVHNTRTRHCPPISPRTTCITKKELRVILLCLLRYVVVVFGIQRPNGCATHECTPKMEESEYGGCVAKCS
jgi:hypothetical protein